MKTYEERIEAVSEARMQAEYAETEKLIEIFLDGDPVFVIDNEHQTLVPLHPNALPVKPSDD